MRSVLNTFVDISYYISGAIYAFSLWGFNEVSKLLNLSVSTNGDASKLRFRLLPSQSYINRLIHGNNNKKF